MPSALSTKPATARPKLSRSGLFVSVGLVAALVIGVPVAASAAPAATVVLTSTTATPSASVGITASGFQPNEALTFTLDAATLPTYPGSTNTAGTADAAGTFQGSATIPAATAVGTRTVTVTGTTPRPPRPLSRSWPSRPPALTRPAFRSPPIPVTE